MRAGIDENVAVPIAGVQLVRTTSVRKAETNRAMARSLLQLQRRNGLGRAGGYKPDRY